MLDIVGLGGLILSDVGTPREDFVNLFHRVLELLLVECPLRVMTRESWSCAGYQLRGGLFKQFFSLATRKLHLFLVRFQILALQEVAARIQRIGLRQLFILLALRLDCHLDWKPLMHLHFSEWSLRVHLVLGHKWCTLVRRPEAVLLVAHLNFEAVLGLGQGHSDRSVLSEQTFSLGEGLNGLVIEYRCAARERN